MGQQVLQVGLPACGVDDQQQVAGAAGVHAAGDDQVVEDAAGDVGEEGVALLAGREADDVGRHQRLERGVGAVAAQPQLAHVRDVEQRGRRAALAVLGEDAGGVAQRQLVAGKRHHARAERQVQGVQRGLEQGSGHGGSRGEGGSRRHRATAAVVALAVRFT